MLEHRGLRLIVERMIGKTRAEATAVARTLSPRLVLDPEVWYGRWCSGVERDGDRATAVLVSPSARRTISAASTGEVLDGFGDRIHRYIRPVAPPAHDVDATETLALWHFLVGEGDRAYASRFQPRRVADEPADARASSYTVQAAFIEALGLAFVAGGVHGAIAWDPAIAHALAHAPWPPRFDGKPGDPCPRCGRAALVDVTTISPPGGDYDYWESPNTDVECPACKRRFEIVGLVRRWDVGGA